MKDDNQQNDQKPSGDDKKITSDDLQKMIEDAKNADSQKMDEKENVGDGHVRPTDDGIKNETDQLKDALARTMADFQNFKRRSAEDKMRFVKFANAELLRELLPIIDNFDRGCQHIPEGLKEDAWAKGVIHTHDDLMKALEKIGVKKMETVGQKLDPAKHNALMQAPGEKDVIIEELEPGYTYNGDTLKPAKVKVGDGSDG